jgi:ubiquitin-conjugating enzyme E2 variant
MAGINETNGNIDNNAIPVLKNWNRNNTIEDALKSIRKEMESPNFKKLKQPDEFSVFP